MIIFKQFAGKLETIPASTSWYLADLGEARGRQGLYTQQAPQKLKILRVHALIERAVSSNRIEGVTMVGAWTKRCRVSTLTKNLEEEHKRREGFAKTDI